MKSELRNLIFTIVLTSLFFFEGVEAHSVIQIAVPDTFAENGDTIAIPVIVSEIVTEDSIYSYQMTLTFDTLVLIADSAYSTGTIAQAWGSPFFNKDSIPGQIGITMAGWSPLSGSGPLVYVVFIVNGLQGDTTTIHFDQIWLNETPPDVITDGLFEVTPGTDVEDENEFPGRPTKLTLFQNYPNPFNPITVIQYALSHNCEVDITVYNITGQKIRTLVKHKEETGYRQVTWDGRNDEGKQVASGIYFYRLKAGDFTLTKRMLLLR